MSNKQNVEVPNLDQEIIEAATGDPYKIRDPRVRDGQMEEWDDIPNLTIRTAVARALGQANDATKSRKGKASARLGYWAEKFRECEDDTIRVPPAIFADIGKCVEAFFPAPHIRYQVLVGIGIYDDDELDDLLAADDDDEVVDD